MLSFHVISRYLMQSEPLGKGLFVISRSCVRVSCYLKLLQFLSNSKLCSIFAPPTAPFLIPQNCIKKGLYLMSLWPVFEIQGWTEQFSEIPVTVLTPIL